MEDGAAYHRGYMGHSGSLIVGESCKGGVMKYTTNLLCPHYDETPLAGWGKCVCPPDCGCREYMCVLPGGGVKFDQDKPRMGLLDPVALRGLVAVLTHGAVKYGDYNWAGGMKWSRPYDAILRHLLAFWEGEDLDQESRLAHLDHAAAGVMFLSRYYHTGLGLDDRPFISVGGASESSLELGVGEPGMLASTPAPSVPGVGV